MGTAAAIVVAALIVVACGSPATGGRIPTTQVNLPPSYRFDPADISVSTGATVTWSNRDNFPHNVQFTDGGLETTAALFMNPGETQQFNFASAGTFDYICSLHPQQMKGSVVVAP